MPPFAAGTQSFLYSYLYFPLGTWTALGLYTSPLVYPQQSHLSHPIHQKKLSFTFGLCKCFPEWKCPLSVLHHSSTLRGRGTQAIDFKVIGGPLHLTTFLPFFELQFCSFLRQIQAIVPFPAVFFHLSLNWAEQRRAVKTFPGVKQSYFTSTGKLSLSREEL